MIIKSSSTFSKEAIDNKYSLGRRYFMGCGEATAMLDKDGELYFYVDYCGNMGTSREMVYGNMKFLIPGLKNASFSIIEENGSPDYEWKAVVKVY